MTAPAMTPPDTLFPSSGVVDALEMADGNNEGGSDDDDGSGVDELAATGLNLDSKHEEELSQD